MKGERQEKTLRKTREDRTKEKMKDVGFTVVLSAVRVRISADLDRRSLLSDGSQLVPTSGGVRVELCTQSLSSCSPSTGTFGCYGCYGGWTEGYSSRATTWFDSEYMYCVCFLGFWKSFHFFYVKVFSGSEVDSRLALLGFFLLAEWRSVHRRCFGCFPVWLTWIPGHYFYEPSHLAVACSLSLHCC